MMLLVRRLFDGEERSFVNGDFHPGNVMTDGKAMFYVCDWCNAGIGYPAYDLGRCLAVTKRWYGHADLILKGYVSQNELDSNQLEELRAWESWYLMKFAMDEFNKEELDRAHKPLSLIST